MPENKVLKKSFEMNVIANNSASFIDKNNIAMQCGKYKIIMMLFSYIPNRVFEDKQNKLYNSNEC